MTEVTGPPVLTRRGPSVINPRMRNLLVFVTVLSLSGSAFATEWSSLGARATAMGGAGVALPNGGESAYWNPAGLGEQDNPSGLQVPVGAHIGLSGDVLKGANDLNQIQTDCKNLGANKGSCTQTNISNAISEMNNPNNGVRGDVAGGVDAKFGRAAFFANNFTYVGGKPQVDVTNVALPGGGNAVTANSSSLILRGVSVTEFGAAYGHEIGPLPGLFAGLAVKGMAGRVGYDNLVVASNSGQTGNLSDFTKNSRQSFALGVDAGALWDLSRTFQNAWWHPRAGITARNINNPQFKNPDAALAAGAPSRYSIQGNTRAGFAISPLSFWNIAVDGDLTRNLTALEGVKSQEIGVGTEINVFNRSWINIPLRAGLSKNVAVAGSKTALAGGIGFDFLHFNVDVGANVTPSNQTVQSQGKSQKLPSELTAGAQLALLFGGGPGAVRSAEKASGAGEPVK